MKTFIVLLSLLAAVTIQAQISAGKIVFERKTNLEKKFTDGRMKKMMGDTKIKIDLFDLYFNDTCSIFKPILTDEVDPTSWATTRNTISQNFKSNQKLSILNVWGQELFVTDTNTERAWKITESKRHIANYECYKAIWQKDDSTRIYAWFSIDIVPTVGPEGFSGLPGAILGLATEDGGIIYFAKSVEIIEPKKELFYTDLRKKDVYTLAGLRTKFEKEMGNNPMAKRMYLELFRWL
jgi:GLPGLI family protein